MRIPLRRKTPKIATDEKQAEKLRHQIRIKSDCPPEVLAERDRVASAWPVSITAAFFGDPAPGRSALDQRGQS